MKLTVFGASGGTGRRIVEQALGHGHDVTAFVHRSSIELTSPRLTLVSGDVLDFDSVSSAVEGADAVASALGATGKAPKAFLENAVGEIVHAMAVHDVRKVAVVSAAGTFNRNSPSLPLAYRALVKTVLRGAYDDFEAMEQRVIASDLVWTIVRPVGLVDGEFTGGYRFTVDGSIPPKSRTISRADVAAAVLKSLETDLWDRRAVTVAD